MGRGRGYFVRHLGAADAGADHSGDAAWTPVAQLSPHVAAVARLARAADQDDVVPGKYRQPSAVCRYCRSTSSPAYRSLSGVFFRASQGALETPRVHVEIKPFVNPWQ
jgi:hypothetical protein